jgi:hypothetical protein
MDVERLQGLDLEELTSWLPSCPKKNSIQVMINAIAAF